MALQDVLEAMSGLIKGFVPFDQSPESGKALLNIDGGVCRALVIRWLRSKKDGTDFWKARGSEREGLLDSSRRLADAINVQQEYDSAFTSRWVQDPATERLLGESGLRLHMDRTIASAQSGFASRSPSDQPEIIATKVKNGGDYYFILGIGGSSGAHSIGIYRDWKIFGPDQIYVFEPNFGEFLVEGIDSLSKLLFNTQNKGYGSGMDLNKNYILWSYGS